MKAIVIEAVLQKQTRGAVMYGEIADGVVIQMRDNPDDACIGNFYVRKVALRNAGSGPAFPLKLRLTVEEV